MKGDPLPAPAKKGVPFDREDMHALLKTVSTETLIECLQIIGRSVPTSRYWMINQLLNYMDDPVDLIPRVKTDQNPRLSPRHFDRPALT